MRVLAICLCSALTAAVAACGDKKSGDEKRPPITKPAPTGARDAGKAATSVEPKRRRPAFERAAAASGTHWTQPARAKAIQAGKAVIKKHECTRCHDIDGISGSGRAYDCASCHKFILSLRTDKRRYTKIAKKHGADTLERYIKNVKHLIDVPKLTGVGKRLRPQWIAGYVQNPHDIRPVLEESMVRNRVSPAEANTLARYFAAIADVRDPDAPEPAADEPTLPPPDAARLALGKDRFRKWGCPSCHTFGNVDFGISAKTLIAAQAISKLAPNLRYTRDRMTPEALLAWIQNPESVQKGSYMAQVAVEKTDAELIRDYLLHGDPGALREPTSEADLLEVPAPLKRKVTWAEVKEEVLGDVCVHCHMNDYENDTGPGNKGGLGYDGIGLAFRTYERTVWGAVGKDGKRYSVLVPLPGEKLPRLVQSLLTRRVENRRDTQAPLDDRKLPGFGTQVLGMPMGLPARTDHQIALVRAWIAQGCPGPTEVTGKPGFTDGFLVPDGPIKKNKGCELRAPEKPGPAWSSRPKAPKKAKKPKKPEK